MSILDIFTSKTSSTQDSKEDNKTSFLGFSAGPTHGLGFTYRKTIGNFGIQTSVLPYKTTNPENQNDESSFYAGGLTGFLILNKGVFGNLYVSLGGGAYRRKNTYTSYIPLEPKTDENQTTQMQQGREELITNLSGGVGFGPAIGMEFNFAGNFTFSIELPMAFIFAFKDDKIQNIKFTSVLPIPNVSLLYRF